MKARAALLLALVALAGCGATGDGVDRPNATATLILEGAPSAMDVGIYVASSRGYDEGEGVQLAVRAAATPDTGLRRLKSGSAQFAVLDIHDLALARQRGQDVVGVMAIAQLPIASVARATLRAQGRAAIARRLDFTTAPRYPELVLAVTRETLRDSPAVVRAAVTAIKRGYDEELQDPQTTLGLELARVSPARASGLTAQLANVEETFTGDSGVVGTLSRPALRAWAAWEAKVGIVRRAPDIAAMFPPLPGR